MPVVDLIERVVPEARIVTLDIFRRTMASESPGPGLQDASPADLISEARELNMRKLSRDTSHEQSMHEVTGATKNIPKVLVPPAEVPQGETNDAEEIGPGGPDEPADLVVPEVFESRDAMEDSGLNPAASEKVATQPEHSFSPAWIEAEALKLLSLIKQDALLEGMGGRKQVLLAGYGFSGIVIKQVRYHQIWPLQGCLLTVNADRTRPLSSQIRTPSITTSR